MSGRKKLTDLAQIAKVALKRYQEAGLGCVLDVMIRQCQDQACLHVACTHRVTKDEVAAKVKQVTKKIKEEFDYVNWSIYPVYYIGMKGKFHRDIRRNWRHHKTNLEK